MPTIILISEIGPQAEHAQNNTDIKFNSEIGTQSEHAQNNTDTIGKGGDDVGLTRAAIETARKREKAHAYMSTTMKKRRS